MIKNEIWNGINPGHIISVMQTHQIGALAVTVILRETSEERGGNGARQGAKIGW